MQHHIRKSLRFPEMGERREVIEQAHRETFRWLVDDASSFKLTPVKTDARERYAKWLVSGTGIFHIIGKPGSGKSTLMKLLSSHSRTRTELLTWAG
jgi:ABC-type polysaccharide/polyol phosphate transport system ATPase subunit